jgi:arsenate reductase-like glutaredoxin family protein
MPKTIDWMYARSSCVTCKRAHAYLGEAGSGIKEAVSAHKTKIGPEQALKLLDGVDKVVAMKGKKVDIFDLKKGRPADEVLLAHLIGPTGNLRAPTARIGRTLLVGFNEDGYREFLGVKPI